MKYMTGHKNTLATKFGYMVPQFCKRIFRTTKLHYFAITSLHLNELEQVQMRVWGRGVIRKMKR